MTDSVFDEMKEVLALQKKAHIDEGPASYELRLDRLNRLSQMLKKYSDEIVDTISEDYGTRDKNSKIKLPFMQTFSVFLKIIF